MKMSWPTLDANISWVNRTLAGRVGYWVGGSGERPRDSGESGLKCGYTNQLSEGEDCLLVPVRIVPWYLQYKRGEECCGLDIHIKAQQS